MQIDGVIVGQVELVAPQSIMIPRLLPQAIGETGGQRLMPPLFGELDRIALAVDHLELLAAQVRGIPTQLGQDVLAQDGARHMPGGIEHDGANFAGQNGSGALLLADDDPAGKHLVAGLHHAQTVVGNIDQHVAATSELIHQIATPQVTQQQAGAHLRAGI